MILLILFGYLGVNSSLQAQCSNPVFSRTTAGVEDYTVPAGVTEITVEAVGADGGTVTSMFGGSGGTTTATYAVNPGDVIRFIVGEAGERNSNGGGNGGGSTAIINCGSSGANCDAGNGTLLLVAAGGGGAGLNDVGIGATTVVGSGDGGAGGFFGAAGGGAINGPGLTSSSNTLIPGPAASQNPSFTSRLGEGFSGGGLGTGIGATGGGGGGYTGGDAGQAGNDPGTGGSNFIISAAINSTNLAGTDGGGSNSDGSACITSEVTGLAVTLTASSINCFGDNVTYTASATGATNYTFFLDTNQNGQVDSGESLQSSASGTFVNNTIPVGNLLSVIATDGSLTGRAVTASPTPTDAVDPTFTSCLGSYTDNLNVCDEYVPDAATLGITATDNCPGNVSITFSPAMLSGTGTTSVTATATDLAGNTTTCTFDLTLNTSPDKLTINATADVFSTDQFVPITFTDADLLMNDNSTPMGLTLEVEEVTLLDPSQGSLTEVDETTYTFTPAGGFTGTANLSYTLKVQNGASFFEGNGHFYEVVGQESGSTKFSWTEARDSAENKILAGLPGYLATITSQEENEFIVSLLTGKIDKVWIGASDNGGVATFGGSATEGDWRWVTGPEGQANGGTGTPFWLGDRNGSPVGTEYNNWAFNQNDGSGISPNNLQGIEHYAYMYTVTIVPSLGQWDDNPFRNNQPGFVVEYGGVDGCSPSVTANANISINVQPDANTGFITTWKVDAQDPTIDIFTDPSFSYNFTVDWGDGNTDMNVTNTITHTYASPGVYSVKIGGTFPRFMSDNNNTAPGNAWKIESIDQWGDIQWESMFRSFNNAINMKYNASDAPDFTNCNRLSFMFANCLQLDENTDLSNWDVSGIELFNNMFLNAVRFNGNIDNWDLSSATVLQAMFQFARSFNRDISGWDLSNVQDIRSLFSGADSFNQDIGDWDVSNVTDMIDVFNAAISFNQDISTWERTTPTVSTTANVINMRGMFSGATAFNQDISNWDVSNVRDMKSMFFNATSFNQDLGSWDLSALSAVVPLRLFLSNSGLSTANYDATLIGWAAQPTFPSNISPVGVAGLKYCAGRDARQQLIDEKGWFFSGDAQDAVACGDLPFVTTWEVTADDLEITIYNDPNFNYDFTVDWGDGTQDMNATGTVTHTYAQPGIYTVSIIGVFPAFNASGFLIIERSDPDNAAQLRSIEQWGSVDWESLAWAFYDARSVVYNATDVPDLSRVNSMGGTFGITEKFNASLNDWDVSKVQDIFFCFGESKQFNGDISRWDVSNVNFMSSIFFRATNFNQPLDSWDVSNVGNMAYVFEEATNFNQPLNSWDVSNVSSMYYMFRGATSFNQPLDLWDVSNVKVTSGMFGGTTSFNQPLDSWDVSNVRSMFFMFFEATSFNQPLNSWDVSNARGLSSMFTRATSFNQPLDSWDVINVTSMSFMFFEAISFNQSLANWNLQSLFALSSSTGGTGMFNNSGIDKANYDATLIGWAANPNIASNIVLGAEGLTFCAGAAARTDLINNKGWTFEGDMEDCPSPNANEEDDIEARTVVAATALTIHPNPANTLISISFQEAALNSQLVIRDQLGRVVWSQQVGSAQDQLQLTLDRQLFPAGMYWVSLDTGETVVTEKLIVVK
ncbi:MAG: BspA family leucine-rich repeat surface protein [Bacteroidota bacterium]